MDVPQIEAFLVLCEELHFGRTAARLHVAAPRVSKLVAALEREVGAALFERTSRQVRTTPLGRQLHHDLAPAYAGVRAALAAARTTARTASGTLRVGYTATTAGEGLTALLARFARTYPHCDVVQREVSMFDPYGPLRRDEIDVLVNWHYCDEPDLVLGPVIARQPRAVAMAVTDPLAAQESVSIEDLGHREVADTAGLPTAILDVIIPPSTPSGAPLHRSHPARSMVEVLALVATGAIVHPTVESLRKLHARTDVEFRPIHDLPPMVLGLVWRATGTTGRVQALAALVDAPEP